MSSLSPSADSGKSLNKLRKTYGPGSDGVAKPDIELDVPSMAEEDALNL